MKLNLNQFDEILLVGSGKGVVSTSYIVDSNWKRRKSKIFNSMYKTFEKEFKKQRELQGPGGTFTFGGKPYTTDYKEEV